MRECIVVDLELAAEQIAGGVENPGEDALAAAAGGGGGQDIARIEVAASPELTAGARYDAPQMATSTAKLTPSERA